MVVHVRLLPVYGRICKLQSKVKEVGLATFIAYVTLLPLLTLLLTYFMVFELLDHNFGGAIYNSFLAILCASMFFPDIFNKYRTSFVLIGGGYLGWIGHELYSFAVQEDMNLYELFTELAHEPFMQIAFSIAIGMFLLCCLLDHIVLYQCPLKIEEDVN